MLTVLIAYFGVRAANRTIKASIQAAEGAFDPKPNLSIQWPDVNEYHDWHKNTGNDYYETFWLRLPIRNNGKGDAQNVQIHVESISQAQELGAYEALKIIPFRFHWAHTDSAETFIPNCGGLRLAEVGSGIESLMLRGDPKGSHFVLPWLLLNRGNEYELALTMTALGSRPKRETILIKVGRTFSALADLEHADPGNVNKATLRILPLRAAELEPLATIHRAVDQS